MMADTTILPNADGTGASNYAIHGGPVTRFGAINNGVSTPDDTDYIRNYLQEGDPAETAYFGFEDMPESFDAATGCSVVIRQKATNTDDGAKYQIFKADGSTALTNQLSLSAGSGISSSYRNDTLAFTVTGDTDKTSWDGAQIKIIHDGPGDGDDPELWISEIEMTVTHTETGGGGGGGGGGANSSSMLLVGVG